MERAHRKDSAIMNRNKNLNILNKTELWDLLVIGGGATGLGAALDAASRGMKVLLIEKHDFSKGTSSKSTKLVHGGVRYLRNGEIGLVKKALKERDILRRNAPHLVHNMTFIIPIYHWIHFLFYGIGLKIYDLIAGKKSFGKTLFLGKKRTLANLNGLNTERLKGGISYQDGQFDDARFAISLAQTIEKEGSTVINYLEFMSYSKKDDNGYEILLHDKLQNTELKIKAKHIINATGVFGSSISDPLAHNIKIRASRGTHIVIDSSFLCSSNALMVPKTEDGRVLFMIPWKKCIIVGTTDVETSERHIEPKIIEDDIVFILNNVEKYLSKKPQKKDIKSVFCGLRPLISNSNGQKKTKELSREHILYKTKDGVLHILGGKWTTYRMMGEEAIDALIKSGFKKFIPSKTRQLKMKGYASKINFEDPLHVYGSEVKNIKKLGAMESFSDKLYISEAVIRYAVQYEMAMTLEDVLARRIRALFLDSEEAVRLAPKVAKIMAEDLGKDAAWVSEQCNLFINLSSNYNI